MRKTLPGFSGRRFNGWSREIGSTSAANRGHTVVRTKLENAEAATGISTLISSTVGAMYYGIGGSSWIPSASTYNSQTFRHVPASGSWIVLVVF